MGLSFLSKGGTAATTGSSAGTSAKSETTTTTTTKKTETASKPASGKVSFLKKGAAAKEAFDAAEARAEAARQEAGKMFQFFMKEGEDRTITFLDGNLNDDGMLDIPVYSEHYLKLNGQHRNFVCTAEEDASQPCPICERGDSKATMVGLLTIIDHTPHQIQNGPNAGKTIANSRKLFKAKMTTLKLLTKIASKRDGLAGCTVDVSRTGSKEPNVGNQFDVTKKWDDVEEFKKKYGLSDEDIQPANYEEEATTYHSPEELVKMGVGKAFHGIGTPKSGADKKSLSDQL